jgi:asparagine synthetase B (glutamine-hydrolysing)
MRWDKNYLEQTFSQESNGIVLHASSSPAVPVSKVEIDRRYYSVLYGEIYPIENNENETVRQNKHQQLIESFIKYGSDFLSKVDGAFLFALWDSKNKVLTIANDIFGIYPLKYYFESGKFIFSTQIKAITSLMAASQLNEQAFAELIALGFLLNDKTLFKDLKRLLPGSLLRLTKEKLEEKQYYHPYYIPQKSINLESKVDEISNQFISSVLKRYNVKEKTAAALSGGFDTRTIWSVLLGKKLPATAATRGDVHSADIVVAKNITKSLNIPHDIHYLNDQPLSEFPVWAEQVVDMTEGLMNIEGSLLIPYYKRLQKQKFELLIDGAGGAILRRQHAKRYGLLFNRSQTPTQFIYQLYQKKCFIDGTVNPQLKQEYESHIIKEIDRYFTKFKDYGTNEDLLDLFYLHQICSLKSSADIMLQSHYINCRQPFYDRLTFEFSRKFTPAERNKLHIHKHIIRQSYKKLELFPLETSDFIIPYKDFLWKRTIPIGFRVLNNKLPFDLPSFLFKPYPLSNPAELFRKELNIFHKDILLDNTTLNRPYWNSKHLEKLIIEHEKGISNHTQTFFQIITAELFLRRFF